MTTDPLDEYYETWAGALRMRKENGWTRLGKRVRHAVQRLRVGNASTAPTAATSKSNSGASGNGTTRIQSSERSSMYDKELPNSQYRASLVPSAGQSGAKSIIPITGIRNGLSGSADDITPRSIKVVSKWTRAPLDESW